MIFDQEIFRNTFKDLNEPNISPSFTPIHFTKVPHVFALSGGKGGVGKTLTTANLGISLSRLGLKTLLIDGDFGLANLDVVLNLRPTSTLDDVLCGEKHLREIIMTGPDNVRIIPSSSGALRVSELDQFQKLVLLDQVEELEEEFDVVLIDTPAGVSKNVQYWSYASSETILVVTPEPTSLADCYATIKILGNTTGQKEFKLIVNMVSGEAEAKRIYEKLSALCEEYLQIRIEYLGFIPTDESVKLSVRERNAYVQKYPFSNASHCMREIARELATSARVGTHKGTLQFFWRRIMSSQSQNKILGY